MNEGVRPATTHRLKIFVTAGSAGIKIDDDIGAASNKKRLRQRDPMSSILFNIVSSDGGRSRFFYEPVNLPRKILICG